MCTCMYACALCVYVVCLCMCVNVCTYACGGKEFLGDKRKVVLH